MVFHRDEGVLVNTCIRHARDQAGIDLSRCTSWLRFIDVQYQRPSPPASASADVNSTSVAEGESAGGDGVDGKGGDGEQGATPQGVGLEGYADGPSTGGPQPNDVSVYFICDVEACVPSEEDWPRVFAEQRAWRKAKAEGVEREQQAILAEAAAAKKGQGKKQVRGMTTASEGAEMC